MSVSHQFRLIFLLYSYICYNRSFFSVRLAYQSETTGEIGSRRLAQSCHNCSSGSQSAPADRCYRQDHFRTRLYLRSLSDVPATTVREWSPGNDFIIFGLHIFQTGPEPTNSSGSGSTLTGVTSLSSTEESRLPLPHLQSPRESNGVVGNELLQDMFNMTLKAQQEQDNKKVENVDSNRSTPSSRWCRSLEF